MEALNSPMEGEVVCCVCFTGGGGRGGSVFVPVKKRCGLKPLISASLSFGGVSPAPIS